ncbi:M50 family metallopeptidase [Thalassomonas viridans]|uniref:M50 family metallopeptidase n=1 Tax=Thalassomonas viridans TaxID=137584 RepID=A0AAE9Z1K0_9GAMM|nr:M50 family metallopeptidase [Thalassomonas viridans]WDE03527.1 M50 family metallopeptidase [Thalassomonas viridans]
MPDPSFSPSIQEKPKSSFFRQYQFWLFLAAAAVIRELPLVSIPFKWLESYFHEISHGIAALVSGGQIVQIQLFPNGAGLCTTRGGSALLISFFGYAGAILWGGLIYSLAGKHQRIAQVFSAFLVLLLVGSMVLWVRDLLTFFILTVLLAMLAVTVKMPKLKYLQALMQLIGVIVLLNSLFSPFYLIDGRDIGDGAALADLTLIPEIIWVGIWSASALGMALLLARKSP